MGLSNRHKQQAAHCIEQSAAPDIRFTRQTVCPGWTAGPRLTFTPLLPAARQFCPQIGQLKVKEWTFKNATTIEIWCTLRFRQPGNPGLRPECSIHPRSQWVHPRGMAQSYKVFRHNSVVKLRASDGAYLGSFSVGNNPSGIAFDGANIWVANWGDGTVSKIQATSGTILSTVLVGDQPYAVAFDGANIWVANEGSGTVSKIQAGNAAVVGTFSVGSQPDALAFDGVNMWVADGGDVTKLRPSDGASLGTFSILSAGLFEGALSALAFDGTNIWAGSGYVGFLFSSGFVTQVRPSDGTVLRSFSVGVFPTSLTFDGANIWSVNSLDRTVSKL